MAFIIGFLVWALVGVLGGFAARTLYRAETTVALLSFVFGVFGAFIGGMLGNSAYIFHNPAPLRVGGIVGAVTGALFFSLLYHFIARKVV